MNRVFVSGGAGVIGMELIPKLYALGATVLVGDLKPRPAAFPSAVLYRQGDLNSMTKQEFDAFAPGLFIHLAATFERSTESYEFWHENFRHNV
jgi:carbamoyl-phosphate synthase large subunit